jgi:hypothetical protein
MRLVRSATDLDECRDIWEREIPKEQISDLWEVRDCFQRHYNHRPNFLITEDKNGVGGFFPLSWNEETKTYMYFPGETWEGKTWLEQNHLSFSDSATLTALLEHIPGKYYLRYLQPTEAMTSTPQTIDEIGYYFLPPMYDFDINNYYLAFSGKSRKRLIREIETFESRDFEYVYNNEADFETMVSMNLQRYGDMSYFSDPRFLNSFRDLYHLLIERKYIRLVTIRIDGKAAAVDMGCVYNGSYTLLAGGTNPEFPGIAKFINLHHMKWACENNIEKVDFLCGDFNWKTLFHLTPQPLYLISGEGKVVTRRQRLVTGLMPRPEIGLATGSINRV